jgi:hypothetical protein
VDEEGDITTVVDGEVGPSVGRTFGATPILLEDLAFPGEDSDGDVNDGDGKQKSAIVRPLCTKAESAPTVSSV